MKIKEVIQQLSDKFSKDAHVKSVYGDPVKLQGKTIIPIARIAYGLGAGGSQLGDETGDAAGGGGGGMTAQPIGVLEVSEEQTRFVAINDWQQKLKWTGIGIFLGILFFKWVR